jgi:hypothetical protein
VVVAVLLMHQELPEQEELVAVALEVLLLPVLLVL